MYKNIVVPIDLSHKGSLNMIFSTALNFVVAFEAQMHLVHIIPNVGVKMLEDFLPHNWRGKQEEVYKKQLGEIIEKYVPKEINVDVYVGRGAIYDQIISYSNRVDADLIILSAVRPELKDYMLGTNASRIVRHSSISVLVVRE